MSKLDDKLRNLKKDIPLISSELDDRVLNVMSATPKKPKFSWPKLGIISASLTPIMALVIILVVTNTNANDQLSPNGEGDFAASDIHETSEEPPAGNEALPGEDAGELRFNAAKSESTAGVDDSGEYYSYFKLTYASSPEELGSEISKYHPEYQALIAPITGEMLGNEAYFANYTVVLVPFVYSSSEQNITLDKVEEYPELNETKFVFELYSPEENDMDIRVTFYVVSLLKAHYDVVLNNKLSINVINTRDNNAGSQYYHN